MAYFRPGILIPTRQEVSLLTQLISHLSTLNPLISSLKGPASRVLGGDFEALERKKQFSIVF